MEMRGMGAFLETEGREISYQEQATRNELFGYLEAERKKMVAVLQDDIAQLVAIAKIKLSDSNNTDAEYCLATALAKLRDLSFNVKPKILEEFGLAITLKELMKSRLHKNCRILLHELPQDMSLLTETALFRLVQETLNTLPTQNLIKFNIEVIRTGTHLCLKNKFTLQPDLYNFKQVNLLIDKLYKAIKPIIYMFNGKAAFQCFTGKEVEVVIYLKELKSIL